jgi:hypothetical protein
MFIIPYTLKVSVDFGAGGPGRGSFPSELFDDHCGRPPGSSLRFENSSVQQPLLFN